MTSRIPADDVLSTLGKIKCSYKCDTVVRYHMVKPAGHRDSKNTNYTYLNCITSSSMNGRPHSLK